MRSFIFLTTLLAFFASYSFAGELETIARQKITLLNEKISEAESKNIDALREKMTVRTAEIFLKYANWDEKNVVENKTYFDLVSRYKATSQKQADDLPDYERSEVIAMLDASMVTLQKIIDGEITRKATPNIDWSKVDHEADQLTYNNRPVFLTDYTWKPSTKELTDYHGNQDGFYFDQNSVKSSSGSLKTWKFNEIKKKASGNIGFVFLGNKGVPSWSETEYGPGFKMPVDRYTIYDIDNPGARTLNSHLLKGFVPYMAGKKYSELGYMLCNEPHFYTTKTGSKVDWASGGVSEFTFAKFRTWLEEKHDSIESLNTAWSTNFTDFSKVSISIPIDNSERGTPKWYDWQIFNNYRVTEWYTWLKSEIRKYDTNAKVHLKVMPNLWSENSRGHGLDMEALLELSEISGNDFGSENSYMWGGPKEWEKHYALEWREFCMGHDFFKSVQPNNICYNTELHFLSKGNFRDLQLDPQYARATFWLSHTLGASSNQIWFWPRLDDGSIKSNAGKGYAGSNIQQPRVVNEVHRTTMDLNSFSEEIMTMQRQRKPLRIFYSETSAQNKPKHMDDVFELYEALCFDGIPIGFASKNIISKQNNDLWDAVLVYKTEYLTKAERDTLQSYLNNGGTVIIDSKSIVKNEYGKTLSGLEQGGGILINTATLGEMRNKAFEIVDSKNLVPEVSVTEINTGGHKGCFWKCVKNDKGNNVLSIVNLGKTTAELTISLKNASKGTTLTNLLDGQAVSSNPKLKPYAVYFVEVTDVEKVPNSISKQSHETTNLAKLHPNPSNGKLAITLSNFTQKAEVSIFNNLGTEILSHTYSQVNHIFYDLKNQASGTYIVQVIADGKTQHIPMVKH